MTKSIGRKLNRTMIYMILVLLLVLSVVPFYLVIVNSTHSSLEIVTQLNLGIGNYISENYKTMQSNVDIWKGFTNSLIIVIPYTLFSGYFGALTAFGFAKYRFRGRKVLFWIVLASMMLPSQLSIIGFYQLNLKLKLINSYLPFIIPGIANATTVFFLRGFISQGIPDSMIEAARMEGCSEIGIFNKLILPCIMPGVATMSIFSFVACWNNYIGPLIIMTDNDKYTLPVMIAMIKGLYVSNYGAMYLAIAISIVPIIIIYMFLSKYIINGLTMGSEK
ncbi:carbohydrate ABC transporter permease [Fusibacter bizertensis]